MIKRLPHMRGFTNIFRIEATPVNLHILEEFRSGSKVTIEKLVEAGVIRKNSSKVKILGDGELTKKLNVTAHAFSKSAKAKIEAAGGSVTIIGLDSESEESAS